MSSAHTCSNEEVMLLTSITILLSHGGRVSSSLKKFHTGGSQRQVEYHKSYFSFEGRKSVICVICLLLKSLKKKCRKLNIEESVKNTSFIGISKSLDRA